jgi:hypothetical protein
MHALPIRKRLVILRDGASSSSASVFCAAHQRSVPLSQCGSCGYGGRVSHDAHGSAAAIVCDHAAVDDAAGSIATLRDVVAIAERAPVGLALARTTFCVACDLPARAAFGVIRGRSFAFDVPVVDERARFIGVLPRAPTALGDLHATSGALALLDSSSVRAIDERASLGDAFARMCTHHARALTVIAGDGTVVGTLRDIDALHFVAHASRAGRR